MGFQPFIAVITRDTRLSRLKSRWGTSNAALFRLEKAAANEKEKRRKMRAVRGVSFSDADLSLLDAEVDSLVQDDQYQDEDRIYEQSVGQLMSEADIGYPLREVQRDMLANFHFFDPAFCPAVMVIGPDGLVANAAKYVRDVPIIGVNPDPKRNDGILLPFSVTEARAAVQRVIKNSARIREVTLAEVQTNDGQQMLAFNEFFVGAGSHVSARYTLEHQGKAESQSSSGLLLSTGAGSTGWLSSVFNMATGVSRFLGADDASPPSLNWEDRRLLWAVREPFVSRHSSAESIAGYLDEGDQLVVSSQMPTGGVIFSDGVESDFLEFNSGSIATFGVSQQQAKLVVG